LFEIDPKALAKEISDLLKENDYHAQGWVTTREVAEQLGESISTTAARLERMYDLGKIKRVKDGKNRLWWRMKKESGEDD